MAGSNSLPAVSVVVISYNTAKLLEECLHSILQQVDLKRDEVWVVDNASSDHSVQMVQANFPAINLYSSPSNRGFSYACNIGWRRTKSPYIFFVNGDVRFLDGSIQKMREKIAGDAGIGILSPTLIGPGESLLQMTWVWNISLWGEMKQKTFSPKNIVRFALIRRIVMWLQRRERDVPVVAGASIIVRREMLEKINGFDEDFELYLEDADLCLRCWQAGYRVRFTHDIKVIHGLGQSGKSNPTKIDLIYRQSQIAFYRKHHGPFKIMLLKIYMLVKFSIQQKFWRDDVFRHFILLIIAEKRRVHLEDDLSVIPS